MSTKEAALKVARIVITPGVRKWLYALAPVRAVHRRLIAQDTRFHDSFYTEAYYEAEGFAGEGARAAGVMAEEIVARFAPASVVDVGCGAGDYLAALREHGVETHGCELASAALQLCHAKGLDVRRFDLVHEPSLPWQADLVMSIEVAEHLPESHADHYVALLASGARRVLLMTAAGPGQLGVNHFNCQPKSYWVEKVRSHGMSFDAAASDDFERMAASRGLPPWLRQNVLVFRRS